MYSTERDRNTQRAGVPGLPPWPWLSNVLAIVNPEAGSAGGLAAWETIRSRLKAEDVHGSHRIMRRSEDAALWAGGAAAEGFDLVVAAGGDGTLMQAVAGLVESEARVPIALLPVGTANGVSTALGVPQDPAAVAKMILAGRTRAFDVGFLPDRRRYFLFMACAGFPAEVIRDASGPAKRRFGVLAYFLSALRNVVGLRRPARVVIDIDGRQLRLRTQAVFLANIGVVPGVRLNVAPAASPHDGRLDISVAADRWVLRMAESLVRMMLRAGRPDAGLRHFQAESVRIRSTPRLPLQIDGEMAGFTPVEASVLPRAVELIVPETYDGG